LGKLSPKIWVRFPLFLFGEWIRNTTWLIFEAGISQVGEMEAWKQWFNPISVSFCNIGDAHMANFEGIYQKTARKIKALSKG